MKKHISTVTLFNAAAILFLTALVGACAYCWHIGLFRDLEAVQTFIEGCGVWAPLMFMLLQIIQITLAFVPGGIVLSAGVVVFGPWLGLLYNLLGTLIGSSINFLLAKRWGKPLVRQLVSEKTREKYFRWLENPKKFDRLFAVAILVPFFPDDALCFIAGLTETPYKRFLLILLLKLPSVAAYSIGYLAAAPALGLC